jgi:hypothetical protein
LGHGDIKGKPPWDPTLDSHDYTSFLCDGYRYILELYPREHGPASVSLFKFLSKERHDGFFGIILAFDIYSRKSWEEIHHLHIELNHGFESDRRLPILVLGLKADLDGQGERVPRAEAEEFARQNGYHYAECSALTGEGVYEALGVFVEDAYSLVRPFGADDAGRKSKKDQTREAFLASINCLSVRYTEITGRDLGLW